MAKQTILTAARLREIVNYNPETGEFTSQPTRIGWECGKAQRRNYRYRVVRVEGKNHLEHRLVWFWVTGQWPPISSVVDHINGDATDNRWVNLRLASPSQNQRNRTRINKNNSSGLTGVYKKRKGDKRWFSMLGKQHLGTFATKDEAHEAYRRAALAAYGDFAPDRLA
jgi:hypothetical protein